MNNGIKDWNNGINFTVWSMDISAELPGIME